MATMYYWDKYNAVSSTSTTYTDTSWVQESSGTEPIDGSIAGYTNISFSQSSGYSYSGYYSGTVENAPSHLYNGSDTSAYYVSRGTVDYQTGTRSYIEYTKYCTSSSSTTYSKGSYITTVQDTYSAHTVGYNSSDGYWWERGSAVSTTVTETGTASISNVTSSSVDVDLTNLYYSFYEYSKFEFYFTPMVGSSDPIIVTPSQYATSNHYETITINNLADGTSYTLDVYARHSNTTSQHIGSNLTFTTPSINSAPYVPNQSSPAYDETINDSTPTFSGGVTDPNGDSVRVTVEVYPSGVVFDSSTLYDSITTDYVAAHGTYNATATKSYPDGTYYWRVRGYDGSSYSSWSDYDRFTISTRPATFEWDTPKTGTLGVDCELTAGEWRGLTQNINQVRAFYGFSSYSFTLVGTGEKFNASIFNEAANAINEMNPPTAPPSLKQGVSDLYNNPSIPKSSLNILPSDLNLLRDSLNSVS